MKTRSANTFRSLVRGTCAATAFAAGFFLLPAPPAHAGVGFGLSVGGGGFSFSLGYSDYPVYSPAWSQPGFVLSFDATLDGYGEWVTVGGLGRVWRPWVAPGWRPYTWGRWVYTGYGWTWVAYEPWGYVPHHYGSWAMTSLGWVWQPGYVYRPANVAWVGCGSRIGWYPAPPRGWSQWRRGWWNGYRAGRADGYGHGYADGWRDARYANFVQWNQMTADNIATVAMAGSRIDSLRAGTVRVLPSSPSRLRVQRAVGRTIPTVRVSERTVSVGHRTVRAVRPLGVERTIATHSRETVRRSLAPSIARTMERGGRLTSQARHGSRNISRNLDATGPRSRDASSRYGGSFGSRRSTGWSGRSTGDVIRRGRSSGATGRSLEQRSARAPSRTVHLGPESRRSYRPSRQIRSGSSSIGVSRRWGRPVGRSSGGTSRSIRSGRSGRSNYRSPGTTAFSRNATSRRNAARSSGPGRAGANTPARRGPRTTRGRSLSAPLRSPSPRIVRPSGRSRASSGRTIGRRGSPGGATTRR